MNQPCSPGLFPCNLGGAASPKLQGKNVETRLGMNALPRADPENPERGAEETDDAVLHHSGSICNHTLGLTLRTFQKYRK